MSEQSGKPMSELSRREKQAYKKYLAGKVAIEDFESKTIEQIVEEYNMQIEDKKKQWFVRTLLYYKTSDDVQIASLNHLN